MAVKKNELAPAAPEPVIVDAAPAATIPARKSLPGIAIAGIVVGAVIVAGALFGGGVLVGTQLPGGSSQGQFGPGMGSGPDVRPDFPDGDNPGFPGGGPGPVMPDGDQDTGTAPDTDSN